MRADAGTSRVERLLDAAAEEFAAKGLAGARVDSIARTAGANKQLVYYYFDSKLGLWSASLRHVLEKVTTRRAPWRAPTALRRRMVEDARRMAAPRMTLWRRMVMWEALERSNEEVVLEQDRRDNWAQLIEEAREAARLGQLDGSIDVEIFTLALFSMQCLPHMLPQVTYLITGLTPEDPVFQQRLEGFLEFLAKRIELPPLN